jgi:Na+/proline symporter
LFSAFFHFYQNPNGVFLNEKWFLFNEIMERVVKMSDGVKNKWKEGVIILIILINFLLLIIGQLIEGLRAFSTGFIGISTFFLILMIMYTPSDKKALKKGEMRKAIAGSFIVVYFAFLSFLIFEESGTSYTGAFKTMIDHFTYLIGIIIVFYFGSRSVEEYMKQKKDIETENAIVQQKLLEIELKKLQ